MTRKTLNQQLREKLVTVEDQLVKERSHSMDLEGKVRKLEDEMKTAYNEGVRSAKERLEEAERKLKASEGWGWWKALTPMARRAIVVCVVAAVFVMVIVAVQ
jgi:L-lactate utilization protein LutB